MRVTQLLAAGVLLVSCGCSEPASKQNSSPNNGTNAENNGGSNNTSAQNNSGSNNTSNGGPNNTIVGTNNTTTNSSGGVGDPCEDASSCQDGLRCQSGEERAWNFCGAPMEPECNDEQIGDSCGNCFTACAEDGDCDEAQTCNGSYCIGPRTCAEEVMPPP